MFIVCVPDDNQSINGYHHMSNRLIPDKTEAQSMRNGEKPSPNVRETDINQSQGTQICCLTILLKTHIYTHAKQKFRVVNCFQPVCHSIIP